MSQRTGISWTDSTWNPVVGCTKVSQGCKLCYAKTLHDQRHKAYHAGKKVPAQYAAPFETVQLLPDRLLVPMGWGKARRIFVNSMSDLFHEDVPEEFIDGVMAGMALAPQHTYQVLTKRPERMQAYIQQVVNGKRVLAGRATELRGSFVGGLMVGQAHAALAGSPDRRDTPPYRPWPFLWLGTSVENQAAADERIPLLLQTPAVVRFISAEPLLGPINLCSFSDGFAQYSATTGAISTHPITYGPKLGWVIVGGESGPGHRPMQLEWLERIVSDCRASGIPVFVKQDSGPLPGKQGRIPDDLWIHEFPASVDVLTRGEG